MEIQWPLLIFSLLASCGGILFAFEGLAEFLKVGKSIRFKATIIAIILLVVGGIASVFHLGQPANIMAAAANIFSFSGISVEIIVLGIDIILALIYLLVVRSENESACKVVGVLGIIGGILIAFVTGNGYVMESQAMWNTIFLPLAYLGTGLAMGSTLYMVLLQTDKSDKDEAEGSTKADEQLQLCVLICAIIGFALTLIYGIVVGFALDVFAYWICALIIGGVGTAVCVYMAKKQPSLMYAALACAVIGGIGLRAAMWLAGSGFLEFFQDAAGRIVLGL